MKLEDLGYNKSLEDFREQNKLELVNVGRVILEHKDSYVVKTQTKELDCRLIGSLRFNAENKHDLPTVGDWVNTSKHEGNKALISCVYPRLSIIERQAVGKSGQSQIIATNVDYGLIVQSVNRDFNVNRLERYLTICNTSKVEPIIILSKIDLIEAQTLQQILDEIKNRIKSISIITISNTSNIGLEKISAVLTSGKTYCLLGSSGVGKSSLLNNLSGKQLMNTGAISKSIDRGRHVTTHRELIVLDSGVIFIDNPGMREIGITNNASGVETTFDKIYELAMGCKFNDCTHTSEKGCAIQVAVASDELLAETYNNFCKMKKEKEFFESSLLEKRQKNKSFGKLVKNVKKQGKRNK